jgi:rubrerythrin
MSDISTQGEAIEMAIESLSERNIARDIATILENEQDMRVMLQNADRPHGEWLEVEVLPEVYDIEGIKTWGSEMQCDQCGFRHTAIEGHMAQYNYCPNCGARMTQYKGGDDE